MSRLAVCAHLYSKFLLGTSYCGCWYLLTTFVLRLSMEVRTAKPPHFSTCQGSTVNMELLYTSLLGTKWECHIFFDGNKVVTWCHVHLIMCHLLLLVICVSACKVDESRLNFIARFPSSQSVNPSIPTSMNSCIYQSMYPSMCFIINLNTDPINCVVNSIFFLLPVYPSIYPSIYLSIHLSIYPSIYLSIYLSVYPSIHLSIYLSIYQFVLFVYLSIYLPYRESK